MGATAIQQAAAAYFGADLRAICIGGTRAPNTVAARHIGQYLEREIYGRPFAEIAALYGLRDHTAALASVRLVSERLNAADEGYTTAVSAISMAVKVERASKTETAQVFNAMACPTCGAPVIAELRRQIAELTVRVGLIASVK